MKKWQIIIVITDLTGLLNALTLQEAVRDKWLPPSHDIILNELKVGLIVEPKDN